MKKILNLPLCDNDISGLRTGDIIYLCGTLVTGRDEVYRRIAEEQMTCPVDLKGGANYHAGPIVREKGDRYELVSIGPTSSVRMEKWAAEFIEKTEIKVMIGKGGMGEKTAAACRKYGAIHCVYPGGCAVLGAEQIEEIDSVFWPELTMAECIWVMRTHKFGPLIVSIDINGNNLFAENSAYYSSRRKQRMNSSFPFLA
ncbi:MAG: FumA C-terminus/TtdB family hydratase beta subunit [Treponema sp.]|nr:FumA C-terminus/TtdB family hydratase beta subunit [Treponema sp.]